MTQTAKGAAPKATAAQPLSGEPTGGNEVTFGAVPSLASPLIPTVPGYEILAELGRGGMGVVYQAKQVHLGRTVALKMILAGGHAGEAERLRFMNEAEAVARLQHPGIVQIHEVGMHDGLPYFSLEFVEGGSLDRKLQGTPLPFKPAARLAESLARAIHAAHEKGILHRDLKPANVFLMPTREADGVPIEDRGSVTHYQPKIGDFGLAKWTGDEAGRGLGLTATGAVVGTPPYMAPEQAEGKGKELGPAVDVYATGAILYELLTGRPPFRAATPLETLFLVVCTEPVPPSRMNATTPRDLETICLKCLAKAPHQRYATALDLAEDLRRFQAGEPIRARPTGRVERLAKWVRRRPVVAALLAMVLLVTLAGVVSFGWAYGVALDERSRAERGENDARDQYARAETEKKDAERARTAAEAQKAAAEEARGLTARANEQLRKQLLRAEELVYLGRITEAHELLKKNDLVGCRLALDTTRWDLRGPEYGHLVHQLRTRAATLVGHVGPVKGVVVSADGNRLYSASRDKSIKGWDLRTGRQTFTFAGHAAAVNCLALSPDGKRLFSGSQDGSLKVWDTADGKEVLTLPGHAAAVALLAVSADGKRLVSMTGPKDITVKLWDAEAGKEIATLSDPKLNARCLALTADGKRLFTPDARGIRAWDLETGKEVLAPPLPMGGAVALALSQDGQRLFAVDAGGLVKMLEVETGKETLTVRVPTNRAACLAFSPDGTRLYGSNHDHTVKVWDLATGKELLTLHGHEDSVECLTATADGKYLVSGGKDQVIRVWRLDALSESHPWRKVEGPTGAGLGQPHASVFSLDGRRLLSGRTHSVWDLETGKEVASFDEKSGGAILTGDGKRVFLPGREKGTLRLWDLDGKKEVRVVHWPRGPGSTLTDAEGKRLFATTPQKTILAWDVERDQELHSWKGPSNGIRSLAVSPDGKWLFLGTVDNVIKVWDVETGAEARTLRGHADEYRNGAATASPGIQCLKVSIDGTRLFSGSSDTDIRVWDLRTGKEVLTLHGHTAGFFGVAPTADGKRLFSWSHDRTIKLWDLVTGKEILTLPLETVPGGGELAVSHDGKQLYAASAGGLQVCDLDAGVEYLHLRGHKADVTSMALTADGKRLLSADGGGNRGGAIRVWDLEAGKELLTLRGHANSILGLVVSPDGKRVYSASFDNTIKVWDPETGDELSTLSGHTRAVHCLALAPDQEHLFSGSADGTIRVWDLKTGEAVRALEAKAGELACLVVSADGERLYSGHATNVVKVWDTRTGEALPALGGLTGAAFSLALSPDGKTLYAGTAEPGGGGNIQGWDLETGKPTLTLRGHTGYIRGLAVSPDGKRLFSGSYDQTVRVWDLRAGKEILELNGHVLPVSSLAVSPDGRRLFSSSWDHTIKVWDWEAEWLARAPDRR